MKKIIKIILKIALFLIIVISLFDIFYVTKPNIKVSLFGKGEIINETEEGNFKCINGPYRIDHSRPLFYSPCTLKDFTVTYFTDLLFISIIFTALIFIYFPWCIITYFIIVLLFMFFWKRDRKIKEINNQKI